MIALFTAAILLAAQPAACSPPEGTDALLAMPQRYIVVGESHGTAETPAAFAQMACAAAEIGPVTIALELPTGMQPQLDTFLTAPDEASATAALTIFPSRMRKCRMNSVRLSPSCMSLAMPMMAVADACFSRQPRLPQPHGLPLGMTVV